MLKGSVYPKTTRLNDEQDKYQVTEKIDGSNLVIFKHENKLYLAQRSIIFEEEDFFNDEHNKLFYKGLLTWIRENFNILKEEIRDSNAICGEWVSMGRIKYDRTDIKSNNFYMFAKAKIELSENEGSFKVKDRIYNLEHFVWGFIKEQIPDCIGKVPFVTILEEKPSIKILDNIYLEYSKEYQVPIEGFVVTNDSSSYIRKYVRLKSGKLENHKS